MWLPGGFILVSGSHKQEAEQMQIKIERSTIKSKEAQPLPDKDVWLWDTEIKGFGLRIRPSGRKVYLVEYRPDGGGRKAPKRRYTIGQHGSPWVPEKARKEAIRILGLAQSGQDPAKERSEARRREGETVSELLGVFIEKYAKRKQRSWQESERVFNREVKPAFGSKRVEDITRQDVLRLINKKADNAPIMANRTLAYVRRFFNWCVEQGYIADSPCKGIKAPGEAKERDRALSDAELAEVWRAVESVGAPWRDIVKLLILTAQRRAEVVELRWDELNLQEKVWSLPAERAKNKRAHEVPLSDTAVAVLESIPRMMVADDNGKLVESPFVFTTTGTTAVSGLSRAKSAIDDAILAARREDDPEASALPHWTYHDLRRTAVTGMARLGIAPHVADAILNHKEGAIRGVAAVYNRHAYIPERRRALEAWEGHVLGLLDGASEAGSNVVSLHEAS